MQPSARHTLRYPCSEHFILGGAVACSAVSALVAPWVGWGLNSEHSHPRSVHRVQGAKPAAPSDQEAPGIHHLLGNEKSTGTAHVHNCTQSKYLCSQRWPLCCWCKTQSSSGSPQAAPRLPVFLAVTDPTLGLVWPPPCFPGSPVSQLCLSADAAAV